MWLGRWEPRLTLAVGVLALACGGDGGGGTGPCTPGTATQLVKTSGDPARWYLNNPLPTPLSVTARDASNCPVPGVVVNWAVASGGGGVNPGQSTTGATGVATTTDSIGSTSPQTVTATPAIVTLPTVTFTATGGAPSTSGAVTVADNVFTPANVVVQVGSTVTWTWVGANPHSVTFGAGTPTSATQTSGPPFDQTFATSGTFNYFCKVHQNMNGSVRVVH